MAISTELTELARSVSTGRQRCPLSEDEETTADFVLRAMFCRTQ